jgi:HD-like signal output (HDOD) protein
MASSIKSPSNQLDKTVKRFRRDLKRKGAPMATVVESDPQVLVNQAVAKVAAIATLPEITSKIISTVEDPRSSATQLHKIVSNDPALVTRMLKVVNSAFYGLPGQIASIERAIVLLGLNAVKNIAIAASLGQLFRGNQLCEGYSAKDLWTHCVAVAVAAREMAKEMKLSIVDEAFLAGMIHDVGILVALQTAPEKLRAICDQAKRTEIDFCSAERAATGVDHQMLGTGLAEAWKFPRSCLLVTGNHHQPHNLEEADRLLVCLVYAADTICCQAGKGFSLTAKQQKIEDIESCGIKIEPHLITHIRQNLSDLLGNAQAAFG